MDTALFHNYIKKYAGKDTVQNAKQIAANNQDYTPVPSVTQGVVYKIRDQEEDFSFVVDLTLKRPKALDDINVEDIAFGCDCEMYDSEPCAHIVAVCMNADVKASMKLVTGNQKFNPRDTMFADDDSFTQNELELFPEDMQKAVILMLSEDAVKIIPGKNGKFRAVVKEAGKKHKLTFRKDKGSFIIHSSCTCNDKEHFMCIHKAAAWYMLKFIYGANALEETHDWRKEEDALLEANHLTREEMDEGYTFDFYLGDIDLVQDEEYNEDYELDWLLKTKKLYSLKLVFVKLNDKQDAGKALQIAEEAREALSGSGNYNMEDVIHKAHEMFCLLMEQLPAPSETDIPEHVKDAHYLLRTLDEALPDPDKVNRQDVDNFVINSMEFLGKLLPCSDETEEHIKTFLYGLDMLNELYAEYTYNEDDYDLDPDKLLSGELVIPEKNDDYNNLRNTMKLVSAIDNLVRDAQEYDEDVDSAGADYFDKQNKEELGFLFRIAPKHKNLDLLDLVLVLGVIKKDRSAHRKPLKVIEYTAPEISWFKEKKENIIDWLPDDKKVEKYLNRLLKEMPEEGQWFALDMNRNLRKTLLTFAKAYLEYLDKLIHQLQDEYVYYSAQRPKRSPNKTFKTFDVLNPQSIRYLTSAMQITTENGQIIAHLTLYVDGKPLTHDISRAFFPVWFSMHKGTVLLWKNHLHFMLAGFFGFNQENVLTFTPQQWKQIQEYIFVYLQNDVAIEIAEALQPEMQYPKPHCRIKLSETGDFLLLTPVFVYHDTEILFHHQEDTLAIKKDGKLIFVQRDKAAEKEFRTIIANLHPDFSMSSQQDYYFLRAAEVMKKMWFFDFYETCKENNIEVYGINKLKRLKFNPNRPYTQYSVSSKTDWFDIDMNVHFGKQTATLNNIQKAVIKNRQYVELSDKSWGILPEEWLDKWGELVKFGKIQEGSLKISKLHFHFIDKLYQELDQEEVKQEIEDKKALLASYEKIEAIPQPQGLKAELRNYQQGGLSWLAFLVKYKWGGILADDMGLGKTIQMLALFQHLKEHKHKQSPVFLVVAPTTLMFNWENEISKFLPDMKYLRHWGRKRAASADNWQEQDIILTTYGTLTSDIGWMKNFSFTVAVLDESQSIKNTASLRFKAVSLLNADYRFALTGTPIENNTMELFAQIQFVNPGFLGTQNFFKQAYAVPIDKDNDKQKRASLKQMVKPFILRRTKERVEKELPPKTEMPLFCEMEPEQREVYEAFKNHYKKNLLAKIEKEGLNKSKMHVLDVLLKLRQISDSPAILNTEEKYAHHSAKSNELLRNIKEKTGKHKILVFSQFVKMLHLIKDELDREQIHHSYLDGTTRNRKEAIETFQQEDDCRVMLISLKAGGLGLNLMQADYVYLVDPWWNPAVEQQAIDRTHRIGQDKHVIAYKMICRDTVEEKILNLQSRKKSLADDLITAEDNFVKKLSVEDIKTILD